MIIYFKKGNFMINSVRNTYLVKTSDYKTNNQPLNAQDYMNVGYMAGRFGINLGNNPYEQNPMQFVPNGTLVNINSCTSDLFEKNMTDMGIKFDRIV